MEINKMENSEIIEESELSFQLIHSEFNDENDHYDENEDDYDSNEDELYDDGIKDSDHDDEYDDDLSDELYPETATTIEIKTLQNEELEDSLDETEDYDNLDD